MLEPFELPFFQRGVVEILILAVPAGLLGTWIVLRRLAFFSHAVGTAAFPGLVLADGLGFAASLGAFGAAAVFAGGTLALRGRRAGQDAAVALVLVGCLAAGVILASDVFGSGSNIETLLFGSLLLVDSGDLVLAGVAAVATVLASVVIGQHWLRAGFEPGADPGGTRFDAVLLGLVALAAVAAIAVVGALLVTAIFLLPAVSARLLTERLRTMQALSVALVAIEGTVGLWLSVRTNAPPGATIACVAGGVFAIVAAATTVGGGAPRAVLAAVACVLVVVAVGCGASGDGDDDHLRVVATTTEIGDFAREVGGGTVEVDQILQPNTDPHDYEPRPEDVLAAADADLVLASGDDLDDWIEEVVSDSGSDARVVDLGAAVPERLPGEGGEEASRFDPHWWHDPRNAEAAVGAISAAMGVADPPRRDLYQRRAGSYRAKLRALDAEITRCIGAVPPAERKLVTDHDAFGYFADRYGIRVIGAVIPSQTTQAQASAKDLSELAETIERTGVRAIFPESSLSSKVADALARQTGADAEHTLYGDSLGPEGSDGATYLGMERANADAMARGFSGGRGCRRAS